MEGIERQVHLGSHGPKQAADDPPTEGVSAFPASSVQRQFWLLHQLAPDSRAYHVAHAFHITGRLDGGALVHSLRQVVGRHEVLRTTFTALGERLVQLVRPRLQIDVPVIDLTGRAAGELEAAVARLVHAEAVRPFDLSRGPLLRALLLRLADEEHVLVTAMHHIITDLQASNQFFGELATLYDACMTKPSCPLERPPRQYADYAVWEQQWLKSGEFSSMLSYWEQQLRGQDGSLALPADRARPAVQSFCGAELPVDLSIALTNDLRRLSRGAGIPLFVTLLSAYLVLLHRYTRQSNIIVGVPFTNRRQSEFQGVMGCFVNVLPLSIDLSGGPSFREVAQRVRQAMLEAHRRQEVTLELIVEKLKPNRDLSHNPLYQVGFTFAPPARLALGGGQVEPVSVHVGSSQLDLFASLWESQTGVHGRLEYSTDLFDRTTIERLADHYRTLLASIAQDADRPIASLSILPETERQQLLVQWNDTRADYPQDRCIHQLFETQVQRTPDAIAVVFEGQESSYGELNRRANQLAHFLGTLGVAPEVLVGVHMERSMEMLVGLLGILKAGGAYLPLDPEFPKERIDYMLDHSQVSVLLTQEGLKEELGRTAATVVCLDAGWQSISRESEQDPSSEVRPENLAYVIYTSGSTGKPKGVQIPQGAAVNFLASMRQEPGLTERDVLLAVTTFSFDISVLELFLPLTVGARTVIVSRDVSSDGRRIVEAIERHNVTVMQATPATWRLMIAAGWKGSGRLKVLCGGEPMPPDLASDLVRRSAGVWNLYGPTETTVWSTCHRLTGLEGPILIGRPIANTQIYILDALMQPVPIGVPGEIYIGGTGVTRGYLKAPDMTAERLVGNPFVKDPEARMYKTGDFGRYLRDGNIQFLGRVDNQVKVRGFRIELGEIEAVLAKHPQVHEATVAARKDQLENVRLVGYVVPAQGDRPTVESLREFLRDQLPYYMVPELYVILEAYPRTPNGKVDRKALPEPDCARPEMEQAYVAPSTACERILSDIWCHVLGLDRVGVHDNFFDLGGNSLLCTQVATRMHEVLGVVVPVVKLFQYSTIASLAKHLGRNNGDRMSFGKIEIRAQRRRAVLSRKRSSLR